MELYPPQKLIRWPYIERHSMNGHFSACGIRRERIPWKTSIEKIRERWESNPGRLGGKRQCYLCAMPSHWIQSTFPAAPVELKLSFVQGLPDTNLNYLFKTAIYFWCLGDGDQDRESTIVAFVQLYIRFQVEERRFVYCLQFVQERQRERKKPNVQRTKMV